MGQTCCDKGKRFSDLAHALPDTISKRVNQFRTICGTPVAELDQTSEGRLLGDGRRNTVAKEDRGFASMDRAKQREIASKGGKAAHQKGTAHEWTSEEARDAGRKGGIASHRRRREQMGSGGTDTADDRGNMNTGNEVG
jgi:general stress protein YciG